jgi:hypothetical protein
MCKTTIETESSNGSCTFFALPLKYSLSRIGFFSVFLDIRARSYVKTWMLLRLLRLLRLQAGEEGISSLNDLDSSRMMLGSHHQGRQTDEK